MEEGGDGGGNGASSSTLLSGGGRQRFEVELRPGETTIVSWKKLVKDANKAAKYNNDNQAPHVPAPPVLPPVAVNPALDSRIAPHAGETVENEANDAAPGSRFSAVIEKIERLYMGKNSSDEEDLNDVPDDDEYDTEDSFIDDTELDEYFQVDDSAIKHDGFFVNRGKLERASVSNNDPTALPSQQPRKRRKDSTKGYGGSGDGHGPNKHMKVNKKAVMSTDRNSTSQSHGITSTIKNFEDVKHQTPILALETVVKKSSNTKVIGDPSPTRITNGEATSTSKNIDNQKTGIIQNKNTNMKFKDGSPSVPAIQRCNDKSSHVQSKSQTGQVRNNLEELSQLIQPRDKSVIHEQSDIKAPKISQQTPKNQRVARKEGSTAKPKSTMLEQAIRDLEKIVEESRPPSMEVADHSSQTVKRRMPPEIKKKLAKVARLAHAIHGRISQELLDHLMSIVGHLIQMRSLKSNVMYAVKKGLSAKVEKDIRLQQLKKQVNEMVKVRIPMMHCKHAGESDDKKGTCSKEMVLQRKYTIDEELEGVICNVYDVFVDGLDEDAGPPVRKLCTELAEMWPKGFVNNHKIRRAICRAKDRKKAELRLKEQKSLRRKRLRAAKAKTIELASDSANNNSLTPIRSISNTLAVEIPNSPVNCPKQEKLTEGNCHDHGVVSASQMLVKTKVKKEPETEKSTSAQGKEIQKSNKQTVPAPQPSITAAPQPPQPTLNVS